MNTNDSRTFVELKYGTPVEYADIVDWVLKVPPEVMRTAQIKTALEKNRTQDIEHWEEADADTLRRSVLTTHLSYSVYTAPYKYHFFDILHDALVEYHSNE